MGQAGKPGPIKPAGLGPFQGASASPSTQGFLGLFKAPSPRLMHQVIRETTPRSREDRETPFGEPRVVLVV